MDNKDVMILVGAGQIGMAIARRVDMERKLLLEIKRQKMQMILQRL